MVAKVFFDINCEISVTRHISLLLIRDIRCVCGLMCHKLFLFSHIHQFQSNKWPAVSAMKIRLVIRQSSEFGINRQIGETVDFSKDGGHVSHGVLVQFDADVSIVIRHLNEVIVQPFG